MLKSLCIKTNNSNITSYLLEKLDTLTINDLYISKLKFKIYTNIIIHYKGNNLNSFLYKISSVVCCAIIKFYEPNIIKRIVSSNYFYFSDIEQSKITMLCKNSLLDSESNDILNRDNLIISSLYEYFKTNKSLILEGFINFRLKKYIETIDLAVDSSVNKFVIDKEYLEFIDLLKAYVNSKPFGLNIVHLIYNKEESTLLDEFKDVINLEDNILDTKYISDISFSSNDYALNTLLTLLPQKICIHLVNSKEDEFINTLKSIFNNRIFICKDCDICKVYTLQEIQK